jgi:hypothetical protein
MTCESAPSVKNDYLGIFCIICLTYFSYFDITKTHRRDVLKQRAEGLSRSLCETFAFSASETVSIASGNRLLQFAGNVSIEIVCVLHIDQTYLRFCTAG